MLRSVGRNFAGSHVVALEQQVERDEDQGNLKLHSAYGEGLRGLEAPSRPVAQSDRADQHRDESQSPDPRRQIAQHPPTAAIIMVEPVSGSYSA